MFLALDICQDLSVPVVLLESTLPWWPNLIFRELSQSPLLGPSLCPVTLQTPPLCRMTQPLKLWGQ